MGSLFLKHPKCLGVLILLLPNIAMAYMGLGSLVPIIGSSIVFIFMAVASILGIIAYPIKKLIDFFHKRETRTEQLDSKDDLIVDPSSNTQSKQYDLDKLKHVDKS